MDEILFRLDELYAEYLRDMKQITTEHHNLRGAFSRLFGGSSVGPGSDSCNDRFYNGMKQCLDRYALQSPSSDEAAQVIRHALHLERSQTCSQSALLMMQAAHGCLLPLVEFLNPHTAAQLSGEYGKMMEGTALLPVQKQFAEALKKQSAEG